MNFSGSIDRFMAHKRESMEDPDLICRVLSSASGKITNQSSSPSEHSSKVDKTSFSVDLNNRENKNIEVQHDDHLRVLSNFSGNEDPYALLRELHILPYLKIGSSGVDFDQYGGPSSRQSFSDMLQCFEGKSGLGNSNGKKIIKERNWKENHYPHDEENEYQTESKCNSFNHFSFFLVFLFLIQYLPVIIVAIIYQVKITDSSSTSINNASSKLEAQIEQLYDSKKE